jgi:hypothetical protein
MNAEGSAFSGRSFAISIEPSQREGYEAVSIRLAESIVEFP